VNPLVQEAQENGKNISQGKKLRSYRCLGPFGAFSQSVIQGTGQVIYFKGQVALDRGGQIVGEGDMAAQVAQVMRNISDILAAMGEG